MSSKAFTKEFSIHPSDPETEFIERPEAKGGYLYYQQHNKSTGEDCTPSSPLRPGAIRGFSTYLNRSRKIEEAESSDDEITIGLESTNNVNQKPVPHMRPGTLRGFSYCHRGGKPQEDECSVSSDSSDEETSHAQGQPVSPLRPGAIRGFSCYMNEEEAEEEKDNRSSIRPQTTRGYSCYLNNDIVAEETEDSSEAEDDHVSDLRPQAVRGYSCYLNKDEEAKQDSDQKEIVLGGLRPQTTRGYSCYLNNDIVAEQIDESESESYGNDGLDTPSMHDVKVELTSESGHRMRPSVMRGMSCYFNEEKQEVHVLVEDEQEKQMPAEVSVNGRRFTLQRHMSKDEFFCIDSTHQVSPQVFSWTEQLRSFAKAAKRGRKKRTATTGVSVKDRRSAFEKK